MKEFKEGYETFKVWHNHKLNILFHFLTSLIQIYFFYLFIIHFNLLYVLGVIAIPYRTLNRKKLCDGFVSNKND